jgi:23S rRNA (cytosine1962-C5)-methyltransferase
VHEEGIAYAVRLGDGLSTGIFLDQRANRRLVRKLSAGLRVLNLFAYTCGFTVAAALGGAARTVSVDASAAALERGRENLALSGIAVGTEHALVADDVFRWLARARETFDLVILDPPSYASTRSSRFSIADDYGDLFAKLLARVVPGGRVLACTNHRKTDRRRFRRVLDVAARSAKVEVAQLKDLPEPLDFPSEYGAEPHLKSALVTLA